MLNSPLSSPDWLDCLFVRFPCILPNLSSANISLLHRTQASLFQNHTSLPYPLPFGLKLAPAIASSAGSPLVFLPPFCQKVQKEPE